MSRQTIKDALKSAIVTAATAAGSSVEIEKTDAWPEADLPGVNITALNDKIEYTTAIPPRTRLHTLTLHLEVKARDSADSRSDEIVDDILGDIDAALADHTLGGACRDLKLGDLVLDTADAGDNRQTTATQPLTIIYTSTEP